MKSIPIKITSTLVLFFSFMLASAQNTVTIGSEMLNEKAVLMLVSPSGNQGLILPVVSNRTAVGATAAEKGMMVYDDSDDKMYLWNGNVWADLVGSGSVDISSIGDISDVNTTGAAPGQVLKWNGTAWAPADDQTGGDTGTDNQELGFNETTKVLSITGGNTVDLSSLLGSGSPDDWGAQVVAHDNSLKGDGTDGSPIGLAQQTAANGQVLKWDGTNWTPANDNVASGSGGAVNTSPRLVGDGTTTSPLDLAPQAAHEGDVLKWDGSTWKPAADNTGTGGGATYTAGTGINIDGSNMISNTGDSDNDSGNEIQTLAFEASTNELSISGGNTITIPSGGTDADADPTNEIQNLSLAGTTINITGGEGVDIAPLIPPGGTDDQNLVLTGDVLTIEGGSGSVDLSAYVNDADADAGNELQDISFNAATNELSITDGSTVTLAPDDQTLTFHPATNILEIEDGNNVDLSSLSGGGGTDDQGLILTGDLLTIEDGSGSVDLSTYRDVDVTGQSGVLIGDGTTVTGIHGTAPDQVLKWSGTAWAPATDETGGVGSSLWVQDEDDILYNAGNVGIGTTLPDFPLVVSGNGVPVSLRSTTPNNVLVFSNPTGFRGYSGIRADDVEIGTLINNETGKVHLTIEEVPRLTVDTDGNVGIGTLYPSIESGAGTYLTLSTGTSTSANSFPSLELQGDSESGSPTVGRIDFISNSAPGNSAIARIESRIANSAQFNGDLSFSTKDGTPFASSRLEERMTIKHNGRVGIGTTNPTSKLDVKGDTNIEGNVNVDGNVNIDGEVNRPSTGTANMLPIAYGQVSSEGNIELGSNNFTVNRTSEGRYEIRITSEGFSVHYICMATINEVNPKIITVWQVNNVIRIATFNRYEEMSADHPFYFVVYKP